MERSAIRSVAFGGFDKEDVARYIEQLSQETEKLREERDALQEKADCLEKEAEELRTQVQELTKAREELSAEMARLAPLEKENAQLKEQVEALRPDAEAHVMLRGQVGAIECEARQRAAELEEHTAGQMHKALDLFRQQYQPGQLRREGFQQWLHDHFLHLRFQQLQCKGCAERVVRQGLL